MLDVQAPNHIRRKSRYWNALKTRRITLAELLQTQTGLEVFCGNGRSAGYQWNSDMVEKFEKDDSYPGMPSGMPQRPHAMPALAAAVPTEKASG